MLQSNRVLVGLLMTVLPIVQNVAAQISDDHDDRLVILLSGASFATASNRWFEMGCEQLGADPVNRAKGGESIVDAAQRMYEGALYSAEELEDIDIFVIMQVHDQDVFHDTKGVLRENYEEYSFPLARDNYVGAFDYVLKKYMDDCFRLREDSTSRYYGSLCGKPAVILLCTHWHDGRQLYNRTIRLLAEKWGLPVVEFDRYVGFSRHQLHPSTKGQSSVIYSVDTQIIDGQTFGWHPQRGDNAYIQRRMAAIFASQVRQIWLLDE